MEPGYGARVVSDGYDLCSVQKGAGAMAAKRTARGRAQDRKRVASGQKYEVSYEAKKTGKSAKRVKAAVKKAGNSRKKVERELRA
jgi:hypothetical protein